MDKATKFLKSKGLIDNNNSKFIIEFTSQTGTNPQSTSKEPIILNELLDEYHQLKLKEIRFQIDSFNRLAQFVTELSKRTDLNDQNSWIQNRALSLLAELGLR